MVAILSKNIRTVLLLFMFIGATSIQVSAWVPWDRPIRRKIEAPTKEAFFANVAKLQPDLSKDTYSHLVESLTWLAYYNGAKLRLSGILNPELAIRNMLDQVHKKSAFDIIMMAEDLYEKETAILAEYKLAQKLGKI